MLHGIFVSNYCSYKFHNISRYIFLHATRGRCPYPLLGNSCYMNNLSTFTLPLLDNPILYRYILIHETYLPFLSCIVLPLSVYFVTGMISIPSLPFTGTIKLHELPHFINHTYPALFYSAVEHPTPSPSTPL